MVKSIKLFLIILFALASCSEYKTPEYAEELSEEIPDTVFYNFRYTKVTSNRPEYSVEAAVSRTFTNAGRIELEGAVFTEYDSTVKTNAEGKAASALYNINTEDITIDGDYRFYSAKEKASISGKALYWNNKKKTIEAGAGTWTSVKKNDGSFVEGSGFKSDTRNRTVDFSYSVRGEYYTE
jgi:LPS export ABC transporter protein LptC